MIALSITGSIWLLLLIAAMVSPWLSAEESAKHLGSDRSKRFILREARAGRLRHARIAGGAKLLRGRSGSTNTLSNM